MQFNRELGGLFLEDAQISSQKNYHHDIISSPYKARRGSDRLENVGVRTYENLSERRDRCNGESHNGGHDGRVHGSFAFVLARELHALRGLVAL